MIEHSIPLLYSQTSNQQSCMQRVIRVFSFSENLIKSPMRFLGVALRNQTVGSKSDQGLETEHHGDLANPKYAVVAANSGPCKEKAEHCDQC